MPKITGAPDLPWPSTSAFLTRLTPVAAFGGILYVSKHVLNDTLVVQKRTGYLPENAPRYPDMSARHTLT